MPARPPSGSWNSAPRSGAPMRCCVDVDYEVLGSNNGMLMVTASGTAVLIG